MTTSHPFSRISQSQPGQLDILHLKSAIEMAGSAPPSLTAFSVGSVIVSSAGLILSTGYSRELGDSWHAEAVAIEKLLKESVSLSECTLYSSLEPCSVRKSGKKPCCSLILEHGIKRVVFAMREPPVFVNCCGAETLKSAGVTVIEVDYLSNQVARMNAHLINGQRK